MPFMIKWEPTRMKTVSRRRARKRKERSPAQVRAFARFQGKGTIVSFSNRLNQMLEDKDLLLNPNEMTSIMAAKSALQDMEESWDNNSDSLLNAARERKGE
jgi:hypothetical protein